MAADRKPCVVEIDPTRFKEGVREPGLAALLTSGWTVATSIVLEDPRAGNEQRIALVLAPPQPLIPIPQWAAVALVSIPVLQLVTLAVILYATQGG